MSTIRPGMLLFLIATLSGCQTVQDQDAQNETHWYQVVVEQPPKDTDHALKYYQQLLRTESPEFA